jgi:hypothetical protein
MQSILKENSRFDSMQIFITIFQIATLLTIVLLSFWI